MRRYGEFLISSVVVMPSLLDSNRKTDLQIDSDHRRSFHLGQVTDSDLLHHGRRPSVFLELVPEAREDAL